MFHVILYEPEIPQNTGNIIRLCANTGNKLHLIEPLGFPFSSSKLKRAGLDYHEFTKVLIHRNFIDCIDYLSKFNSNIFYLTTKAKTRYDSVTFKVNDAFVFGPETRGLPSNILDILPNSQKLKIPMIENSRSINLANTVAVMVYEAWRQLDFQV